MKTPERAAAKWSRNLAASTEDYKAGILGVAENPMAKAAQNVETYLARIRESAEKWQRKLLSANFDEWKRNTAKIGAENLATRANQAVPKYLRAAQQLFPLIERARAEVKRMPNQTRQQRIARSVRFQELMSEAVRTSPVGFGPGL